MINEKDPELYGWLTDVSDCINKIPQNQFTLRQVYMFCDELKEKHPDNNNIKAKIRQQLQFLRDRGYLELMGNGVYRKLHE